MLPERYWWSTATMISRMVPGGPSPEVMLDQEIMQRSMNGSPEILLAEMDEAGIDKTVVYGVDWGLALGEPKVLIHDFNKYVADAAKEYPDKFIPFFTIDPRRPNASKELEMALTTWEMKGLKLHPSTGYLPDGEECYELYKIVEQYQIPVITHSGYIMGLKGRTARPIYFDAPTSDFPNTLFSFAHLNFGDVDELIGMMFMKPNVYCDISAHGQILMMNSPPDFYRQLRFALNHETCSYRVMFGSDWPITKNLMSLAKWVDIVKNLGTNEKVKAILEHLGYRGFRSKEINLILGKNAIDFLSLK
jgi:predicted TIM-barrel fold metal-dependent hydrolase